MLLQATSLIQRPGMVNSGPRQMSLQVNRKLRDGMLPESSICTTDLLPSMAWISASMPK